MSEAHSEKLAPLTGRAESQAVYCSEYQHPGLDELSIISRNMLMDQDLDVRSVRPFFQATVDAYVERFQEFPFDPVSALFRHLEMREFREQQWRDLVCWIEERYQKQHGRLVRESEQQHDDSMDGVQLLDDEVSELRERLKYAAIAGERIDGEN